MQFYFVCLLGTEVRNETMRDDTLEFCMRVIIGRIFRFVTRLSLLVIVVTLFIGAFSQAGVNPLKINSVSALYTALGLFLLMIVSAGIMSSVSRDLHIYDLGKANEKAQKRMKKRK